MSDVLDRAKTWLDHDPDPATCAELSAIIDRAKGGDAAALEDLDSRFSGPLTFGTAGLRGAVAAGETRMNVAVVTRATAGVAQYLLDTVGPGAKVVVGCDARHGSSDFMDAALEVLAAAGLNALALPKQLPTPVTAYAVRALDCDAGIMVTASHNPPADNGYKVYLGGRASDEDGRGVQIVPPADAEIAARIDAAPPADKVPRSTDGIDPVDQATVDAFVKRMATRRTATEPSKVRVVFTPMHGVGGQTADRVRLAANVPDFHPVPEQNEPDPDFPTVSFPNPGGAGRPRPRIGSGARRAGRRDHRGRSRRRPLFGGDTPTRRDVAPTHRRRDRRSTRRAGRRRRHPLRVTRSPTRSCPAGCCPASPQRTA